MALFVSKFAQYIQPLGRQQGKRSIGVLGHKEVHNILANMALYHRTPFSLLPLDSSKALMHSDVLFFGKGAVKSFQRLVHKSRRETLLITSAPKLLDQGADVSFYCEGDKLKFYISRKNIETKGLEVGKELSYMATWI